MRVHVRVRVRVSVSVRVFWFLCFVAIDACVLPCFCVCVCGGGCLPCQFEFLGAFTTAVFVTSRWLTTAHWLYTDVLAMSTAVVLIASVRLPSGRSAAWFLLAFVLYDTFWVLIFPLLVHDSVMEVRVRVHVCACVCT